MLIYFFSITCGMYFATIFEFIIMNSLYLKRKKKRDFYEFYKGRPTWEMFDYQIVLEHTSRRLYGGVRL
jgi:hypothetical protein